MGDASDAATTPLLDAPVVLLHACRRPVLVFTDTEVTENGYDWGDGFGQVFVPRRRDRTLSGYPGARRSGRYADLAVAHSSATIALRSSTTCTALMAVAPAVTVGSV